MHLQKVHTCWTKLFQFLSKLLTGSKTLEKGILVKIRCQGWKCTLRTSVADPGWYLTDITYYKKAELINTSILKVSVVRIERWNSFLNVAMITSMRPHFRRYHIQFSCTNRLKIQMKYLDEQSFQLRSSSQEEDESGPLEIHI